MSRISLWRLTPRWIMGVYSVKVDMFVYISLSQSHIISVLSPTSLCNFISIPGFAYERRSNVRLVVALSIRNCFLAVSAIRQRKGDVTHIPLLILLLLQKLDVHIRNSHSQTIVKANATERKRQTEGWHPRHVLSDGDAFGVQLVEHFVCERKVGNAFFVNARTEIFMITPRKSPIAS